MPTKIKCAPCAKKISNKCVSKGLNSFAGRVTFLQMEFTLLQIKFIPQVSFKSEITRFVTSTIVLFDNELFFDGKNSFKNFV